MLYAYLCLHEGLAKLEGGQLAVDVHVQEDFAHGSELIAKGLT